MKSFSLARIFLVLLPVVSVTALAFTIFNRSTMKFLFIHGSYYLVGAMVLTWAYYLGRYLKAGNFSLRKFFFRFWPGLAVAFGLTLLVFFTVKPGYRVLNDETTLIAVSKSMALDQTIYNTMMGYQLKGQSEFE